MIWLYLSYAAIILGAIKLAMMLIMQIAGDISDVNLQSKYRHLSNKKGVFKPKVSAVMLATNITSDFDLYVDSVLGSTIQPNEFLIFIEKANRKSYNKLRYYRDKHGLGGYIKLVKYSKKADISSLINKNCIGTYLILLDGKALLTPKTLEKSLVLFRQDSLQALLPNNIPKIDSTLKSGLIAVAKVVKANYFRAQPISRSELAGILIVRKKSFKVLSNNGYLLKDMNIPRSLKAYTKPKIIRNPIALVKSINIDKKYGLNAAITALWLMDLATIAAILYIRGSYEGWILIGFVAVLIMFLILIAILGYRGLSFMNRVNLVLLAPITYLVIYLLIVLNLIKLLGDNFKNKSNNTKKSQAVVVATN